MADRFDTTRWSLVLHAASEGEGARTALETLCRTYRPPVFAYVRAHQATREHAEDLTQSFFAHLLEQRLAARADPERGKFRALLLTSLKHFLANERERASTQRRGGGATLVSLDAEPGSDDGPEQAFEREWAQAVLREALRGLHEEAKRSGKEALFARLKPFLLEAPDSIAYDEIATQFEMRRNTVAVAVHRLRARLQELVRQVIADTVADQPQADQELRHLRSLLNGRGAAV